MISPQRVPQRVHVESVEPHPLRLGAPQFHPRSHVGNPATSSLAHIQVGHRSNPASIVAGVTPGVLHTRTQRLMRQQSGQSPSTPIQVNPCSSMSRRLSSAARHS